VEAHQTSQPAGNDDLIFTLFLAAMSRPEAERDEFLREACSANLALLAQVERRVKWEARLNGFLLTPVVARDRADRPFAAGDTVLRRFRILRVAGEGGMGVVYEAFDEKLGNRIALKCPRFEFRKRLSPEAMKSLRVTHANVCRVFEIHTEETNTGEVDFLTMEFLDGETLAARLPRAPARWLETPEGKEIVRQICAGLKAVHGQDIVHRDLKPSNVMLSTGAAGRLRVVIMDFGIAQGTEIFSSAVRGTPAYLAPELWKGQPATVQSDLYALGVLLYEMASARLPFLEGTSWNERLQTLPPPPEIREPLRSAVLRCLHPDPKRRLQNAGELEEALGGGRSRRWLLGSAAGVGVSLLTGAILKERFWPSSAVRLVILPPSIDVLDTDASALINGFVQSISYRLKAQSRLRRPLAVFSLAQIAPETAAALQAILSTTHVISSVFRRNSLSWSISAELIQISGGRSLQRWNRASSIAGLAVQLFALEGSVVDQTIQQLALRTEPKRQTLTRESYADYLKGLYYARFDYEDAAKAIPYFERVIAAAPQSALGYVGLAEAYLGVRGDKSVVGKAQTAVARAEQLDPELAQVHYMKGRVNVKAGWYELGLAELRRAAELDPHDAEVFIEMAYAHYLLNQPRESEAALLEAVAAEPGYYKPYLDAGEFFYLQRNFAVAEQYWLRAVELGPRQTRARLNLAELYTTKGRLEAAESQIYESLKIRKTQDVLASLGALQERSGRLTEAIASYKEAIQVGPRSYRIWAGLGRAYRRAGRAADAGDAFRKGLEFTEEGMRSYPREPDRVAWCAYYHANLGEVAQTRSRAAQALDMAGPTQADVRRLLVLAYDLIHDIDAAFRLLEGAPRDLLEELARSPDISDALRRDPRFDRLTH
jgi:serine/threonine protein kinase/Flp pilus assembly protein TadD